ncbi:hypothetical protein F511_26569 [Dorcoceras hygrometricum]|uniref:Uncharacterized protein n=1 Tax=Dorcoceras hygrometricum TaxID=472368 RepID=A0A2Z7AG84_9LAMI|nr:hypothetical protein F511_26569 [Dorcoceras hygrometricum]
MGDCLSDSDDEKAVEEILAQAMDLCVVEQVAAINLAGLNNSVLPSHLETRFQKLKSFPSSTKKSGDFEGFQEALRKNHGEGKNSENDSSICSKKVPVELSCPSPSKSPVDGIFSPTKTKSNPNERKGRKEIKSESSSSLEDLSSGSLSPPVKKSGCFLCSPKVVPRKKSRVKKGFDSGLDWEKNDDFLSDLSNFSVKSQRKMMKKAMKDEDEICREAEKIVKWAKHASARMDVSGIKDELSDDENLKFH